MATTKTTTHKTALPKFITSLDQLSPTEPTRISKECCLQIDGLYFDFDGNTLDCLAKGARWTVRSIETDARLRDVVIAD